MRTKLTTQVEYLHLMWKWCDCITQHCHPTLIIILYSQQVTLTLLVGASKPSRTNVSLQTSNERAVDAKSSCLQYKKWQKWNKFSLIPTHSASVPLQDFQVLQSVQYNEIACSLDPGCTIPTWLWQVCPATRPLSHLSWFCPSGPIMVVTGSVPPLPSTPHSALHVSCVSSSRLCFEWKLRYTSKLVTHD